MFENVQKIIQELNEPYYDSNICKTLLEKFYEKNVSELKRAVNESKVMITKEEITNYLDSAFETENAEAKKRIEEYENQKHTEHAHRINEEAASQWFTDKFLTASKYEFNPAVLEYYEKYIKIMKNKVLLLLTIIESLTDKCDEELDKILNDIDVEINEKGEVSKEDLERLLLTTVYNIDALNDKLTEANDLSSYFYSSRFHRGLRFSGNSSEYYPSEELQLSEEEYDFVPKYEYLPLSENQKIKAQKHFEEALAQDVHILKEL